MAPEVAIEVMRAFAEETNRRNRERRSSGTAWQAELGEVEKEIRGFIEAIKARMFHVSMKAEMEALEAREAELTALLADAPADIPDRLPCASALCGRKVEKLTEALSRPEDGQEATKALRMLIERIDSFRAPSGARATPDFMETRARS